MNLALFLAGGLFLWLGAYGYMQTANSAGMRPLEGTAVSSAYSLLGGLGQFLAVPYLLILGYQFEWWLAPVFLVVGGLLTGVLYSKLVIAGAALPLIGVPLGLALCATALIFG
jgi:hypothetical protein